MARIARETKMAGLIFDPEEYGSRLWSGGNTRGHSRADTIAKARQRGREFADAIFKEYPNMKLFCFFWLSSNKRFADNPESASLFIPFINGVYDNLPPEAVIIEGDEGSGYMAKNPEDYYKIRADFHTRSPKLLDKANISKYRNQTQLAIANYMDPYFIGKPGNAWYEALCPELENVGHVKFFGRNLKTALEVSDEYVWTWAERMSWWPSRVDNWHQKTCEGIAPGITEAVLTARAPLKAAEKNIAANDSPNLLKNADFAQGTDGSGKIPRWGFVHDKNSAGICRFAAKQGENGANAVSVQGASRSYLTQMISVRPGKKYFFRVRGKITVDDNSPFAHIRVIARWRMKDRRTWIIGKDNIAILGAPDADGWREASFIGQAPENAFYLYFMVAFYNQSPENKAYIDRVEARCIEANTPKAAIKPAAGKTAEASAANAEKLITAKDSPNLLRNGDFVQGTAGSDKIPRWGFVQGQNSAGTCRLAAKQGKNASNAVIMQGVSKGYLTQMITIKPGKKYLVSMRGKISADEKSPRGSMAVIVQWRKKDRRLWTAAKTFSRTLGAPGAGGWRETEFVVESPDAAAYLFITLTASGLDSKSEACFDSVGVYSLSEQ